MREVLGDYQLGQRLGAGGTSEVFAAIFRGAPVAIKVLRDALVDFDAVIAEAAKARAIAHPAVVRVFEVGQDAATGRCFIVMERLDEGSLADRLAAGALPESEVRVLGAAIADGMDAAHARGVIHRDLKPGNIMFRGGAPVIVDFGIARSLGAAGAAVTQQRIGTLAYMAPEQLASGVIAPSVDVWALGVILFEAATGRLPFPDFAGGQLPQLVQAAPPARVAPALDAIIARCLAREPSRRFASMAELAAALRVAAQERMTQDVGDRVEAANLAAGPRDDAKTEHRGGVRGRRDAGDSRPRWFLWTAGAIGAVALGVGAALAIAPLLGSEPAATLPEAAQGSGSESRQHRPVDVPPQPALDANPPSALTGDPQLPAEPSGPQRARSGSPEPSGPQPALSGAVEPSGPQPALSGTVEPSGPQPALSGAPKPSRRSNAKPARKATAKRSSNPTPRPRPRPTQGETLD